jgi:hypothetical protein
VLTNDNIYAEIILDVSVPGGCALALRSKAYTGWCW